MLIISQNLEVAVDRYFHPMKGARKQPPTITAESKKPTAYQSSRTRMMLNGGMKVASTVRQYAVEEFENHSSFDEEGGKGI